MSAKGAVGSVAQAGPMAPLIAARLPVIGLPTPSRSAARSPPHALFISADATVNTRPLRGVHSGIRAADIP